MQDVLEALRIISSSWPMAAMVVGVGAVVLVTSLIRRTTRASMHNTEVQATRDVDLKRIERQTDQRVIDAPPKQRRREED